MTPRNGNWQSQLNTGHQWITNLTSLTYTIGAIWNIILMTSNPAKVCSGWYLADLEKENDVIRSYYEIETGYFLYVLFIINIITLALQVCCCFCLCLGIILAY